MEVLLPYILQQRGLIDEHHFWLNTIDAEDLLWIHARCAEHPDYLKMVPCPTVPNGSVTVTHFYALPEYRNERTIVIKVDDDIVFIAPNAIWNLLCFRLEHPEYFVVFANTFNNSWMDYLRQRQGMFPTAPFVADLASAWASGEWAEAVHRQFLADLACKDLRKHEEQCRQFIFIPGERVSINFVCWLGEDMARLHVTGDDEAFLTCEGPALLGKANAMCGSSIVCHFAFFPQREHMDATNVLEQYLGLTQ